MTNYKDMEVTLKRIDVCDLLLACLAAEEASGTTEKDSKWSRLHEKLKAQLHDFDAKLEA